MRILGLCIVCLAGCQAPQYYQPSVIQRQSDVAPSPYPPSVTYPPPVITPLPPPAQTAPPPRAVSQYST